MTLADLAADSDDARGILTSEEIRRAQPASEPLSDAILRSRALMEASGQWDRCQFMGRRWPIATTER